MFAQTLLDLGASTDYKDSRGLTPLYHSAMVGGDPYCCELLLHDYAKVGCVDENGWQEIHQVSGRQGPGGGRGALAFWARPTQGSARGLPLRGEGRAPLPPSSAPLSLPPSLEQACRYGHVQHLEHLLFYGADMTSQNASGNTALHVCALYNQVRLPLHPLWPPSLLQRAGAPWWAGCL